MRPMSEEVPTLTGRTRVVVGVAVGLVLAAGLVLRFWTRSALWLDEALTVDIARLPLQPDPRTRSKHDGAPPLYYYLLHFWIVLFGQSNDAVRSLSGVDRGGDAPGGLVLRQAPRWAGRGLDDARAAGQRPLRRVLRDGVAHVCAGHPPDRLRFPGAGPGGRQAPPRQPHRRCRRDGGAPLYAVLGRLSGGDGRDLARRLGRPQPAARAPGGGAVGRADRGGGRCRALRALGADVRLSGQVHGHPVGGAAQLLRRDQRPHGLHGQPGFHAADGNQPGAAAGRHLLRHAGARGVRPGPVRTHHRARPAHPPRARSLELRGARHAVRRHRRRDPDRQRVLLALRRGRVPALHPSRRARDDRRC